MAKPSKRAPRSTTEAAAVSPHFPMPPRTPFQTFVHTLGHDLRNPLSVIAGCLDYVICSYETPAADPAALGEALQDAQQAVHQIAAMITRAVLESDGRDDIRVPNEPPRRRATTRSAGSKNPRAATKAPRVPARRA